MRNFIKIAMDAGSAAESEILIADLAENDFYAFEQNEDVLMAYIKEEDFDEEKLKSLLPQSIGYECSVIAGRNWNEDWESQFHPVTIKNFVGIRASFHEALEGVEHEIIITPKMSFGTGHHATTFLMVEQIEKINFKNLLPLINEVTTRVNLNSPHTVQTGPAIREDIATLNLHLQTLSAHPDLKYLYLKLSESILKMHEKKR